MAEALLQGEYVEEVFKHQGKTDYDGEGYIPASSVPFAYNSFDNLLLIRLDGSDQNGAIYFANHDLYDRVHDSYTISLVSASFAEFLDALYVDEE